MSQPARTGIIVGMPAYNEAKYIGSIILQARRYADEVIVADDGSTDATANIARLAGALATYLGDAHLRTLHGKAARQRAIDEFGLERMAGQYRDLYLALARAKAA